MPRLTTNAGPHLVRGHRESRYVLSTSWRENLGLQRAPSRANTLSVHNSLQVVVTLRWQLPRLSKKERAFRCPLGQAYTLARIPRPAPRHAGTHAVPPRFLGAIQSLIGAIDQLFGRVSAYVLRHAKAAGHLDWSRAADDGRVGNRAAKLLRPVQTIFQ